jgi:hypothetical protein
MMAFTPQEWQNQAKTKLRQAGRWIKRRTTEEVPFALYGMLCSLSLWPLVEAAQAGQFLPVVMALGSVAGGVGGNLLAEQIQRWTDQADAVDERAVAGWVAGHASTNPELREALDTLLEKTDAISEAQVALEAADQTWFLKTLWAELAKLGNQARFEATVADAGLLVQGEGAIGIQQREQGQAIVRSEIGGDVLGAGASITYILNQYLTEEERLSDPDKLEGQQIANYLGWLADRCGTIELRGIKREGQQVVQLDLEAVYIPLAAAIAGSSRSISLAEVLSLGKRIVLTGGPGSGKTTVLLHIAWALARAIITDNPALARSKLGLLTRSKLRLTDDETDDDLVPLPIFVPLSAYAAYLRQLPPATPAYKRTLAAFISHYLIEKQSSFDLPDVFFNGCCEMAGP